MCSGDVGSTLEVRRLVRGSFSTVAMHAVRSSSEGGSPQFVGGRQAGRTFSAAGGWEAGRAGRIFSAAGGWEAGRAGRIFSEELSDRRLQQREEGVAVCAVGGGCRRRDVKGGCSRREVAVRAVGGTRPGRTEELHQREDHAGRQKHGCSLRLQSAVRRREAGRTEELQDHAGGQTFCVVRVPNKAPSTGGPRLAVCVVLPCSAVCFSPLR